MNLSDLFAIPLAREPGRVALRFEPPGEAPRETTFAELHGRAERLAAGFAARGLQRGDRVALLAGNRPELLAAYLALWRCGAVAVPMNTAYRGREVAHVLADAEPRWLLAERSTLPVVEGLGDGQRGRLERVLLAEDLAAEEAAPGSPPAPAGPPVAPDELALLLYTSGTTGRSKGAMLTHGNLLATVCGLLAAWGWSRDDELLLALPLFHTHGLVVGACCALAAGATIALHPRFDAEAVASRLAAGGATCFFGVPTMYVRLVEALRRGAPAGVSRVRLFCSGSAPLAPATFAEFRELTGHAILERYGMTETGMNLSNPYVGERRPGTVGTPLPGVSVRIVDREGREVPPGGEGELEVRGSHVFAGYWRDPERTAASFAHDETGRRWLRTGDLARRDPATGAYSLLGRGSELVLCGGFNVYPREVEEVLAAFPGVREAAVVGMPDAEWGEVPVAFVVAGEDLDEAALAAHCREQLAGFKRPRAVRRVEALPRNALGKVEKHVLRRELAGAAAP